MTAFALAFACGVVALQWQAALPAPLALALIGGAGLAALVPGRRAYGLACCGACALGFAWAAGWAQLRMADRLAPDLEGIELAISGVVLGLPAASGQAVRFEFAPDPLPDRRRLPARLRLSWYAGRETPAGAPADAAGPVVRPGERWALTVRLRRPHGFVNPGGFDYEAWLLERGIGATGDVRARPEPRRLGERAWPVDHIARLRAHAVGRIDTVLGAQPAAGILAALAVGAQNSIAREEWELFRRTGVTHLMSISGLHVTLVSGLAALLVSFGWRRVPALCLALPARKAGAAAAMLAALVYALIAGFAVPTQRTLYMVAVIAVALWRGRLVSPSRTLALALCAVLVLDPWAPLAPGFWLSFGAVVLIFYVTTGWAVPPSGLRQWLRVQWAVTLGLAPASVLLFSQVSLVGPIANALAIPLVSVVITPLAIAAAALPFDAPLQLGAWLVGGLLQFLEWCASLPFAVWQGSAPPPWALVASLAGVAWLLAPRAIPGRWAGAALCVPAFALPAPSPALGEAWVTVLDVGQGLAVIVRTSQHALLYDAGPAWGGEADAGERVVLPVLRHYGIERLDRVVLSHADRDHVGGAASVFARIEAGVLVSSLPRDHPLQALAGERRRCQRGESWQWDGVRFEFLHPAAHDYARGRESNAMSCVLRVSTGSHAVVLTGDLDRHGEVRLARETDPAVLRADVLVVPHHGGRGGASHALLRPMSPRWAVVPVGYRSRFGHPDAEVLARLAGAGVSVLRTDLHGAVAARLAPGGVHLGAERLQRRRYWQDASPG